MVRIVFTFLVLCLVNISLAAIFNGSIADIQNKLIEDKVNPIETRRLAGESNTVKSKKKKHRSTSSSSGSIKNDSDKTADDSIALSGSSSSTDTDEKTFVLKRQSKNDRIKSSKERKGWRKWHRKCPPCPDDMRLKWRDPRVKWICGGYQRARRSFKSECMMYYRNCQDGTMFTKIMDGRCKNSTPDFNQGDHFFYDYSVSISDEDSSKSKSKSKSKSSSSDSDKVSSVESWNSEKYGHLNP